MKATCTAVTFKPGERCVVRDTVKVDHPAIPGHFPGYPVVPAVVLLDCVSRALSRLHPDASIAHIEHVKFLKVLPPGQAFDIVLSASGDALSFDCVNDAGMRFATGKFRAEVNPR